MNRTIIHTAVVVASALVVSGCVQTRPAAFTPGGVDTDPGGDSTAGTDAAGSDTGADDESTAGEPKLDLAAEPDTPAVQCASITQTTEIEERPADIILIADRDVDRQLIQDQVTNLLPGMESEGVFDANVVHIFDGGAPDAIPGEKFSCGEWACRGASQYQSVYAEFETATPAGGVLEAILATHDQWAPHMRAQAWKHIWITTTASAESGMSNEEFAAQLSTQLDALGTEGGVFVHAFGSVETVEANASGYTGLSDTTGGHSVVTNLDFFQFQTAVLDRVKGNALACEYVIPQPPDGQVFDRDRVNVIYDDGDGAMPIGYVESSGDCQTFGFGWYYDDPASPDEIRMCPLSCEQFQTLDNASIDIEFGCATIPAG